MRLGWSLALPGVSSTSEARLPGDITQHVADDSRLGFEDSTQPTPLPCVGLRTPRWRKSAASRTSP